MFIRFSLCLCLLFLISICECTEYIIFPNNTEFTSIIQNLQPGDVATFMTGVYMLYYKFSFTLLGTPSQPIIFQAGAGENVTIFRPNADQNIMDFQGTNFILQGIEFVGGSRGLRLGELSNVSNALFQNLIIHDTEATAFSMNDDNREYNNITIRYLEIYNTGNGTSECFYLGCNYGACTFCNSIVEFCYCHNTTQALDGFGSGVNLKPGSYNNIVQNNVIWNTKGVGLLLYDTYDLGINIISSNLVVDAGDNGIQITAGITVVNNIVVNSYIAGIAGQTDEVMTNSYPRNIRVLYNTVIGSQTDACLRGDSWNVNQSTIEVANNAFFCQNSTAFYIFGDQQNATWLENGYIGAGGYFPTGVLSDALFELRNISEEVVSPGDMNYYPLSNSTLIGRAYPISDVTLDYNCLPRSSTAPTVGAYEYSEPNNPGPPLVPGFKSCAPTAGSSTGTGSSSGTATSSSSGRNYIMWCKWKIFMLGIVWAILM